MHLSDFPEILLYDVFCRVNKGYKTHFPLKTKRLPRQQIRNCGHFGQNLTIENLIFCVFDVVYCVVDKQM